MRNRFDEQLFELNREIIEMGAMCEEAIASAAKALTNGDAALAANVKKNSSAIDQMEREIEARCMKLLLHQQPVARDLRLISAALKMITDMERIGDQAEDIAEIVTFLNGHTMEGMELIEMGAMCEEAIAMVAKALRAGDMDLACKVRENGANIDQMERDIEGRCMKLLLHQQPVARDLRLISAALKMITDMERIGDQAEDIAEIVTFLNGRTMEGMELIEEMARETIEMVTASVDAFVKKDVELAQKVIEQDDIVDDYFSRVKCGIISLIAENHGDGEFALDLLMISKYFERIGDHATNIAEWVIYSVTGTHKEV